MEQTFCKLSTYKINKCSYVRIVEDTPDRIVVHWRYTPDQRRDSFTRFRETYCGDIGAYYAEYADEYFTVRADGTVFRQVKKGCYKLDTWNDPANVVTSFMRCDRGAIIHPMRHPAIACDFDMERMMIVRSDMPSRVDGV